MEWIIGALAGAGVSIGIVEFLRAQQKAKAQQIVEEAEKRAKKHLEETEKQAKEIKRCTESEVTALRLDLKEAQNRLEKREERLEDALLSIEKRQDDLEKRKLQHEADSAKLREQESQLHTELERIAGLTKDEACEQLMNEIERSEQEALESRVRKAGTEADETIEMRAQKILSLAIERFAGSHVVDATTTAVPLTADDMKGRIIGKEGRNIKVLERLTGCELLIDESPDHVIVSGFSPVRRQIAARALEDLMKDGRIQPARIEVAIEDAKKSLAKEMKKAGEEALYELGIPVSSIDPKLVAILGRLKFRTSYGQNVLQHSMEVARISGMIAEELGLDVFACKKGGLFHDIGKAVDHDMQGAHPEIGYNIMKKFGFSEDLCYQSIAHHEDKPRTIEGVVVKAADAISGARPGARRNSAEEYIQRLQALEDTANSFKGVDQAYAIQAGREVRVFINPNKVNDYDAYKLARDIAKRIEKELTYPGEVRVNVIRETRSIEYAR
jgi:ribonuclease Y